MHLFVKCSKVTFLGRNLESCNFVCATAFHTIIYDRYIIFGIQTGQKILNHSILIT